ncbi:hypothetical protein D6C78_07615 [Aureobasidium pullulans]|uniref:DDE-1 domain-containing protein n=1 Tax=Aureobasidium pullulans TaxID=5580 RepID=A0A4T0BGC2_AURPU|nr:hypothetical protein D6C78_07615 [Aureobasidium pullulans]
MAQREAQIALALAAIRIGEAKSIRAAQRAYAVPESTLRARLAGTTNRRTAHQYRKRLSVRQVVDWILEQDTQGFTPSHARTREMATRILRMNVVGRPIEAARINGTHPEAIQEFYLLYEDIVRRFNIQPCNTWNMDEHWTAVGVCTNSYVLASSSQRRSYVKSPESREWVSIIEIVSPAGGFARPLVIFKDTAPQTTHFPTDTPDWLYTTSENGWTTNSKGISWLYDIFIIPETQPKDGQWRLLIMDGHGSHTSTEFLWICKQNKVHLLFLPANTSHVLQPLDLGVSAPLKSRYRSQTVALASLDDALPIKKQRFVTCYNLALKKTFTPRLLRTGWQAAGLYPFNPSKGPNSSQVQAPKPRQSMPPPHQEINPIFTTPTSSRYIQQATKSIRKKAGEKQALYQALHKAGHAINSLDASHIALAHRNTQLQAQLDTIVTKKRRKVQVNPNTQFGNIDNITMARQAQALLEEKEASKQVKYDAMAAARELEEQSFEALQFEWQMDDF